MTTRFLHLHVAAACYHRNGSFGAGYYAIHLLHRGHLLRCVVFDASEHCAVLDEDGESYRAEDYEPALRAFIASPVCERMCWPSRLMSAAYPHAANDA